MLAFTSPSAGKESISEQRERGFSSDVLTTDQLAETIGNRTSAKLPMALANGHAETANPQLRFVDGDIKVT
jgi:hypothetical protein